MAIVNLAHLGATLIGLGLLLGALHLLERVSSRYLSRHLGWNSVLFTGWLGVPLHELGHLAAAKLFGHRVVAWKLFEPDPVSGTLGYVRHAYRRRNLWQLSGSFVIGIAPLLSGGAFLFLLLTWMVPDPSAAFVLRAPSGDGFQLAASAIRDALGSGAVLAELIWQNRTPWLPLQLYLALCAAAHLAPSVPDMKNGALGGVLVAVLAGAIVASLGHFGTSVAGLSASVAILAALTVGVSALLGLYTSAVALFSALASR